MELPNKTKRKNWSIYVLICPIEQIVRYVGITSRKSKKRLYEHCNNRENDKNFHKKYWIENLKKKNLFPLIETVKADLSKEEACILEIKYIFFYRQLHQEKLTNLHPGGSLPPVLNGAKNPNTHKRPFKMWNEQGEEYIFDYIFEASEKFKINSSSISRGLSKVYKTVLGYNICFIDELDSWEKIEDKRYNKKSFKIWNENEEYFFSHLIEASNKLNIDKVKLARTLRKKRKTVEGYFACYLNELNDWNKYAQNKKSKYFNSKKRSFKVWNSEENFTFNYIIDAVEQLKLYRRNLQFVLQGGAYSHKGYFACYLDELDKWVHPDILSKKRKQIIEHKIELYNINTKEKICFSSLDEAIKKLNLHRGHLKNVLLGITKSHKGYKVKSII